MTSRYAKRVGLLVGSAALGTAIATKYRLSAYHEQLQQQRHHPHRGSHSSSSLGSQSSNWLTSAAAPSDTPAAHGNSGAEKSVKGPFVESWQELADYLRMPLETRRKRIYEALFGTPEDGEGGLPTEGGGSGSSMGRGNISPVAHAQTEGEMGDGASSSSSSTEDRLKPIPTDIKTRFLLYARRDPVTGEYVQQLDDFVACLLLLEPFSLTHEKKEGCLEDHTLPASGHGKAALPPAVQTRVAKFFSFVDMDGSRTIDYAEFVVFFTLLSTQKRVVKTAFDIFQHGRGNTEGRVDELDFTRLLNVLMVDPSVQILYDGRATDGKALARKQASGASQKAAVAAPAKGEATSAPEEAFFPLDGDTSSPSDCAMSLASQTRRARRSRRDDHGNLTFTMPSSRLWNLFHGPPPTHELAPPGSMHNERNLFNWKQREQMKHLSKVAQNDKKMNLLSFDMFWYRMDFLRWELRAIEFGIFDPENNGLISLKDFRHILAHDMEQSLAHKRVRRNTYSSGGELYADRVREEQQNEANKESLKETAERAAQAHQAMQDQEEQGSKKASRFYFNFGSSKRGHHIPKAVTNEPVPSLKVTDDSAQIISWQFYQTVFDIIRESDVTLPALRLALNAEPPVLPSQLVAGAIPDGEKSNRHSDVKDLVHQRQIGNEEQAAQAKREQAEMVRPTALTWQQFAQVLRACPDVPQLTQEEQQLFFELFDADRSGTITPEEFSQLCELKRSFFAMYMPRFSEPRRNAIQQFVFCMQQLE